MYLSFQTLTSVQTPITTHATGFAQIYLELSFADASMEPMVIPSQKEDAAPTQVTC